MLRAKGEPMTASQKPPGVARVPIAAYRDFARGEGRPAIFADVVPHWPAFKRWTFDWLRETHGAVRVPVLHGRLDEHETFTHRDRTFGEFLDDMAHAAAGSGYLGNLDLGKLIPALARDVEFPSFVPPLLRTTNHWIGPAGTVSQLHCDYAHNLFAQLVGRKRFELFAPSRELRRTATTYYSSFSALDFAGGARPVPDVEVVVERGEMLFLPYGWWHRVTSLEASISVNAFFWSVPMLATKGPRALVRAVRPFVARAARRAARSVYPSAEG
jgi:hypothetical protein